MVQIPSNRSANNLSARRYRDKHPERAKASTAEMAREKP
jgi:hypothetical protein